MKINQYLAEMWPNMLNPYFIMNFLNVDAQINHEMLSYLVMANNFPKEGHRKIFTR